jgi:glucosamine-phosphate N-acetyltransferase
LKADYEVKELTPEDFILYNESFYRTLENLRESPVLGMKESKYLLEKINAQDSHIFVAIKDKEGIIGTAKIIIEQKFFDGGKKASHIEDVVTRKGFDGIGIAGILVNEAIEFSKREKCYKVILDCDEKLLNFYEKFGFEKSGEFMRMYLK